jgi:ABC-2 type transport system permease protein
MQPDIAWLTVRQLLTRGKLLVLVVLGALPVLLALLYTFSDSTVGPQTFLVGTYTDFAYTVVVPITALVFAAAVLGSELEDGTIVYLLLKPVARWQIVVSKLVPTIAIIAAFVTISIYATAIVLDRGVEEAHVAFAFALGAVLGGAAYAALFTFLGLMTSRALIGGLLYVFIWEGLITNLFAGARNWSIREYMNGIADSFSTLPIDVFDAPLSGGRALVSCIVVVVVFTLLSVNRLRTINLAG